MKNKYIGSNFDEFLQDERLLAKTEAAAIKRVIPVSISAVRGKLQKRAHSLYQYKLPVCVHRTGRSANW